MAWPPSDGRLRSRAPLVTRRSLAADPDQVAPSASDVVAVTVAEAAFYFVAAAAGNFADGCATITDVGNVVTFELDDCSGPLGLAHATGTVTANLIDKGGGATLVQLSGDGIQANGGTYTLNTSGMLTIAPDGGRMLQATSMSNGTGPDGTSVDHSGIFTLAWSSGASCGTINASFSGVGTGSFGGANAIIVNYVACTGACPASGTAISDFDGGSVTLAFNGNNYALCSATDGTSAGLPLQCP